MKEISIEEKAKRYDEALEKAKDYYKQLLDEDNPEWASEIEKIFPELKEESEDERIRKELIDFLEYYRLNNVLDSKTIYLLTDSVAWLEKQETSYTKRDIDDAYLKGVCDAKKELEKQGEQKQDPCHTCDHPTMSCNRFPCDLKKSEQKLTEWNISDFRTWQYIVSDVLTKKDGIGQYLDSGECKRIAKYMQEEWSKKLRVEQNPAWSEEDETHVDSLLKRLEGICKPGAAFISTRFAISEDEDWLKSLKERVGCEVNCTTTKEWSEEDEYKAERLLGWLDTLVNYIHHDTIVSLDLRRERMQQVEQLKTWIKSLRNRITKE